MVEQDLRLVRLAARHFANLQGLNAVIFGSVEALWGFVWLETHSEEGMVLLLLCSLLGFYLLAGPLERYYAERFGRVVACVPARHRISNFLFIFVITLLVHDRWHPVGPAIAIATLGAFPARIVFDGWPYRWHHLFSVAATVLAMVLAFRAQTAYDALGHAFLLLGLTAIPSGFADHALLVRAMTAMKEQSGAFGAAHGQESD